MWKNADQILGGIMQGDNASNRRLFQKLGVLHLVSKLFMALGVVGIIATFLTGKQSILTWSAVSVGAGLAVGFFRQAFRPKAGQPKSDTAGTTTRLSSGGRRKN